MRGATLHPNTRLRLSVLHILQLNSAYTCEKELNTYFVFYNYSYPGRILSRCLIKAYLIDTLDSI